MKIKKVNKNQLVNILKRLNSSKEVFLFTNEIYEIYETVCDGIEEVMKITEFKEYTYVNPVVIILYIVNELGFYFKSRNFSPEKIGEILKTDSFVEFIGSIVCDKYLTNEQLNYKSPAFLNKFNPQISTLSLYFNFCLNILNKSYNLNKYDDLVKNMLKNSLSLGQCIENLLINAFDVEAFSTWRTMHENECILYCLVLNGKETFDSYFRHIQYSLAYRGQIKNKEQTDKIFEEIKSKMKEYNLKSKDMKKFIEYGYLFSIKDKEFNVDFKLNFRDGVETIAGLKSYSKIYELSSEIAHSSPLLIFSNREYYFNLTLLNLYETFFRLEKVFYIFYKKVSKKDEVEQYETLQKIYINQLHQIHNGLSSLFKDKFFRIEHLDNKNLQ